MYAETVMGDLIWNTWPLHVAWASHNVVAGSEKNRSNSKFSKRQEEAARPLRTIPRFDIALLLSHSVGHKRSQGAQLDSMDGEISTTSW